MCGFAYQLHKSNRQHRLKTPNAVFFRSLLATFDTKKRVVRSAYLHWLIDMIAYVENSLGNSQNLIFFTICYRLNETIN